MTGTRSLGASHPGSKKQKAKSKKQKSRSNVETHRPVKAVCRKPSLVGWFLGNRFRPNLFNQLAGVRDAGLDIFRGQTRVILTQIFIGRSCGQEVKNEFNSKTCTSNVRLTTEESGIGIDSIDKGRAGAHQFNS